MYVNDVKLYQFKAKGSEIKPYPMCLGNISKAFTVDNIEWNLIKWMYMIFLLIFNISGINNIVDMHKDLMGEHNIKLCLD